MQQRVVIINPGYVIEAQKLFGAMTIKPSGQRARLISNTIGRLQRAQIWSTQEVFYVMAAHDNQAARLNWKSPGNFTATATNSPTFTADRGYAGDGSTSFVNTGWVPSTQSTMVTTTASHVAGWSNTTRAAVLSDLLGCYDTGFDGIQILQRFTGDQYYGRLTDSAGTFVTNAASNGMFLTSRSGTSLAHYRNGVSLGPTTQAGVALPDVSLYIAGGSNHTAAIHNPGTDQGALASVGGSLNVNQVAEFYRIMRAYMTAVGAP